jgi:uncharacterized protein (UPF0276 family)
VSNDARSGISSVRAGIGLRGAHVDEILAHRPDIAWLEVHSENYLGNWAATVSLERIREHYPLSFHGVSLSLGSDAPLDQQHLRSLRSLIDRMEPCLVSEHLAWSRANGAHLNDLLPLPYTEEALEVMTDNLDQAQSSLGRRISIENPSSYLRFRHSTISEADFLAELVRRTGCGVLLDVNNLFVSAHNVGLNPSEYLKTLPASAVDELHVAGHARNRIGDNLMLIDDHGSCVSEDVWALYAETLRHVGQRPTLIEWDTDLPALNVLLREAAKARDVSVGLFSDPHADAA